MLFPVPDENHALATSFSERHRDIDQVFAPDRCRKGGCLLAEGVPRLERTLEKSMFHSHQAPPPVLARVQADVRALLRPRQRLVVNATANPLPFPCYAAPPSLTAASATTP